MSRAVRVRKRAPSAVGSSTTSLTATNARDAIAAMEQITKADFYAEMKSNFKAYDVDLVEQGITGSASGSAGVSKGKATSEVSVIYMPMPSDDSD